MACSFLVSQRYIQLDLSSRMLCVQSFLGSQLLCPLLVQFSCKSLSSSACTHLWRHHSLSFFMIGYIICEMPFAVSTSKFSNFVQCGKHWYFGNCFWRQRHTIVPLNTFPASYTNLFFDVILSRGNDLSFLFKSGRDIDYFIEEAPKRIFSFLLFA